MKPFDEAKLTEVLPVLELFDELASTTDADRGFDTAGCVEKAVVDADGVDADNIRT